MHFSNSCEILMDIILCLDHLDLKPKKETFKYTYLQVFKMYFVSTTNN